MLQHLTAFQNSVADARGMISDANRTDAAGTHVWHSLARSMFVESSFMKIFISWEMFLERTFIDYMLGNPSTRGTLLVKHVSPLNAAHANDLLIGSGRQQFVDWSTPEIVRRISRICFENGEPYESVLSSFHSDLLDLKTLRNAASHMSSTTGPALDALATRRLQITVSSFSVAQFIQAIDPSSNGGDSILATYCSLLDSAANLIAHF
jgi:hypothetical protein